MLLRIWNLVKTAQVKNYELMSNTSEIYYIDLFFNTAF